MPDVSTANPARLKQRAEPVHASSVSQAASLQWVLRSARIAPRVSTPTRAVRAVRHATVATFSRLLPNPRAIRALAGGIKPSLERPSVPCALWARFLLPEEVWSALCVLLAQSPSPRLKALGIAGPARPGSTRQQPGWTRAPRVRSDDSRMS